MKTSVTALFLLCICTIPFLFVLFSVLSPVLRYEMLMDIPSHLAATLDGDGNVTEQPKRLPYKGLRYQRPHHVILIPFRNREDHLKKFIPKMGNYLQRNFPNDEFTLLVVEQADTEVFNKGVLINIGLTEIAKRAPATHCVIMQDVDLIPKFDGVPYNKCPMPIQLGSELQHFNFSIPYEENCGGVISMHLHDWQRVNGMSNDYVGWGGEDDDLFLRLKIRQLLFGGDNPNSPVIDRPPKGKGVFTNLEGGASQPISHSYKSNHSHYNDNLQILQSMRHATLRSRYLSDGLSDLEYTILSENVVNVVEREEEMSGFFGSLHLKAVGQANYTSSSNNETTIASAI